MRRHAYITGLAGTVLEDAERQLLKALPPAGIIIFARNIEAADQLRSLIQACRDAAGASDLLVLVDQEGGRVQRVRPPLARSLPPAAAYAALFPGDVAEAARAARIVARLAAADLRALDFTMNCAPVLDLPVPGAHDIIGNRAFGPTAAPVIAIAGAFAEGLMAGGVVPVIKHIPGHGRARADSHLELPVVDVARDLLLATDAVPFKALAHLPAAMTAHIVFSAIDPHSPASASEIVTREIIRGACNFDGLLMSDDLGMKALSGPFGERARAVLAAGSDLALHCSGHFDEMVEVAEAAPALAGAGLARFQAALRLAQRPPEPYDEAEAEATRQRLLTVVG